MTSRLFVAALLVAAVSSILPDRSFADDRSIYNRTGARVKLSLTPQTQGAAPIQSPILENNQRWTVDLERQNYEAELETPKGEKIDAGSLPFEDPRRTVANLVRQETKTTIPVRDPATGEIRYEVKTNYRYSFVLGMENVDQNGLRLGVTFIAAPRGVQITQIHPDMPSTRCLSPDGQILTLTPGDLIISINGSEVVGTEGMLQAVARSPRNMRFQVIDGQTGQPYELTTKLAW